MARYYVAYVDRDSVVDAYRQEGLEVVLPKSIGDIGRVGLCFIPDYGGGWIPHHSAFRNGNWCPCCPLPVAVARRLVGYADYVRFDEELARWTERMADYVQDTDEDALTCPIRGRCPLHDKKI